ncbi:MAG: hypothetical protein WC412_04670 [Candidatus Omnitrophota bacterium]|jgi:Tfp pilus assembly protein PilV
MKRVFFKKGVTLSELLIAALIIVTSFTALLACFVACLILNEANRNLMLATSHAQYVMEDIKNMASTSAGFSTIANNDNAYGNTNWDWANPAAINEKTLVALKDESIDTNVTGATFLNVVVTVNWHDRGNRNRSITLETTITEP